MFLVVSRNIFSRGRCCHQILSVKTYFNFAHCKRTKTWNKLFYNSSILGKVINKAEFRYYSTSMSSGMELSQVIRELQKHALTSLAEGWDNVGLLVEPSSPHTVKTLLLTNDLTPPVLEECLEHKVDMIMSYHPPIFTAFKRLNQGNWKQRLIIRCIENRIAVYSPHTAYDVKCGGVNDWLIGAFKTSLVSPVHVSEVQGEFDHKVIIPSTSDDDSRLESMLHKIGVSIQFTTAGLTPDGINVAVYSILCTTAKLADILTQLKQLQWDLNSVEIVKLEKVASNDFGSGRIGILSEKLKLSEAVDLVKTHLKLDHVRLAAKPGNENIKTVAVCAGSGASVLQGVKADLYITGEMSHHDVLDAVYNGSNVILCDHSNTERGFLTQVQEELCLKLLDVNIIVSQVDTDPLKIL